jgi:hypothetical protein
VDVGGIGKRTKSPIMLLFAQKINDEIKAIDEKLKKLMDAYLENALWNTEKSKAILLIKNNF